MRLFRLVFIQRFRKFSYLFSSIIIAAFLSSSCSSSKQGSYAYMDDIYNPGYNVPVFVDDVIDEQGQPPTNVPGAAYVYQPIPEPSIVPSSSSIRPSYYSPFMSDAYYDPYGTYDPFYNNNYYLAGSNYNNPYGYYNPYGIGFSTYFGYGFSNYPYYYGNTGIECPSNGGSSSAFISKRFEWDSNSEQNFEYLSNVSTKSNGASSSSSTRNSSSKKSRFINTNSSSSSSSKSNNIFNNRSSSGNSSFTRGSSNSSTRSSGSSRSGSRSSGSYNGKRGR